jgi:hypothetical protein
MLFLNFDLVICWLLTHPHCMAMVQATLSIILYTILIPALGIPV